MASTSRAPASASDPAPPVPEVTGSEDVKHIVGLALKQLEQEFKQAELKQNELKQQQAATITSAPLESTKKLDAQISKCQRNMLLRSREHLLLKASWMEIAENVYWSPTKRLSRQEMFLRKARERVHAGPSFHNSLRAVFREDFTNHVLDEYECREFMPARNEYRYFCHATGSWNIGVRTNAAHILRSSVEGRDLYQLLGLGFNQSFVCFSERNGLSLSSTIEKQFDRGAITIMPFQKKPEQQPYFKLVIIDQSICDEEYNQGAYFHELDGKKLTFLNAFRPSCMALLLRNFLVYSIATEDEKAILDTELGRSQPLISPIELGSKALLRTLGSTIGADASRMADFERYSGIQFTGEPNDSPDVFTRMASVRLAATYTKMENGHRIIRGEVSRARVDHDDNYSDSDDDSDSEDDNDSD